MQETEYCREFTVFLGLIERAAIHPSYFELLVAFAYWEFARQKVDYAVVEVGLGGLLDGTNVVHRLDKVCVITDIGLDHMAILGNTLAAIAHQKAGIILPHNVVCMHRQPEEVISVVRQVVAEKQAELRLVPDGCTDLASAMPARTSSRYRSNNLSRTDAAESMSGHLWADGISVPKRVGKWLIIRLNLCCTTTRIISALLKTVTALAINNGPNTHAARSIVFGGDIVRQDNDAYNVGKVKLTDLQAKEQLLESALPTL